MPDLAGPDPTAAALFVDGEHRRRSNITSFRESSKQIYFKGIFAI